ncbi:MAG: hypothetical protein WA667_07435 [Candidatus Nitrosopolaris sp.]
MLDGSFNLENKDVKELCSRQVFERGLAYFREGRVSNTQIHGMTLSGDVEGSESRRYRVKIEYDVKNGRLIPKCTCPFDLEEFCKHSITLLLHWIHRREEFLNVDLVLKELKNKSKEELLTLIEESIRMNPDIIFNVSSPHSRTFKKRLEALFSNQVDYYNVHELIEKLEEVRNRAKKLFESKNIQESLNIVKYIIELCMKNYGVVDDSGGMLAEFIEGSLKLYARILHVLNVEWTIKQKIHEDNWKMLVMDKYDLSDYISEMIVDSCSTEEDFTFIERLALEELQESKARGDEYRVSEIVDILLDIYEKKKDEKKFLLLCEKEFEHSYFRYIENLESKGKIDEAIQCCTRALNFAEGFLKTDLIEKMGDLRHTCGDNDESLSLYIRSFKDRPEEELLEKITRLSKELGLWKEVKEELTSFMAGKGDTHNLLEIYLRDKDLASAFKMASQHINNKYDIERVAKACEKSMPYKAAELYRNMAEESIKQSNRNAYRTAKYYFKAMYRLYTSLNKEKEFRQYIDIIKSTNKKKSALLEELSQI